MGKGGKGHFVKAESLPRPWRERYCREGCESAGAVGRQAHPSHLPLRGRRRRRRHQLSSMQHPVPGYDSSNLSTRILYPLRSRPPWGPTLPSPPPSSPCSPTSAASSVRLLAPLLFCNGPRPAASRQSLVLYARDSARSLLGGGLSQKARDQKSHLARGGGGETGRRRWGRGGKVIL